MPYNEFAVTGASQPTAFMDWLKNLLDAHAAWEFVETILDGASWRYDVYRNTGNSDGTPFYMVLRAPTTTTWTLAIAVAEAWDGTAKTLDFYAPQPTTLTPNSGNLYRIPSNPKSLVAASHADIFFAMGTQGSTARTNYVWWNDDLFYFMSSYDSVGAFGGLLTDVWNPTIDPLVLFVGTSSSARVTREPLYGGTSSFLAAINALLSLPTSKEPLSNSYFFSPVHLTSRNAAAWRGLLHSDIKRNGVSFTPGDRVTIDGVEHVYLGSNYVAIPG